MSDRSRFCVANGVRLHYREWGIRGAPVLLLLHGTSAHTHWWDQFAAALADHYHLIALDLRGHGDSAHLDPPAYRLNDYRCDVVAFVDALAIQNHTLIGHSLGGLIAGAVAAATTARLNALVLVDSVLRVTAAGARYMHRLYRFPQPIYASREQAIARFRLLPIHTAAAPTVLAALAEHGIRQLPDGRWTLKFDRNTLAQFEPVDLTPGLRDFRCPVLVVRGGHSTFVTAAAVDALLAVAPHLTVAEIAGAHHHVMLDNPTEFASVVSAFLGRALPRVPEAER